MARFTMQVRGVESLGSTLSNGEPGYLKMFREVVFSHRELFFLGRFRCQAWAGSLLPVGSNLR